MRTTARSVISSLAVLSVFLLGTQGFFLSERAYANGEIQAGVDLFETPCAAEGSMFATAPIPADFFAPGSEPFDGIVMLGGDPPDPSGHGATDTMIRRFDSLTLPEIGNGGTIPIEIIQLNLRSCEPMTVVINGEPTMWDVRVNLSETPQQRGTMTIQKTHDNGGTFDSQLPVTPKFIFTPVMGGDPVILDGGALPGGPLVGTFGYLFQQTGAPWVFEQDGTCPGGSLRIPGETSNFCAGSNSTDRVLLTAQSDQTRHSYQPARSLVPLRVRVTKETRGGDGIFDVDIRPLNIGAVSTHMLTLDTRPDDDTPHFADSFFDVFVDIDGRTGLIIQERSSKVYQSTKERCMFESIDPKTEQPLTCDLLNEKYGKIILKKETDPVSDPQTFDFTGDLSGTIGDGGMLMKDVPPGTYVSTETVPSGWKLFDILCNDSDSIGSIPSATATYNVAPGEIVTCTFQDIKTEVVAVPRCNGLPATIYVDAGNHIVGGPQNGNLYIGVLNGTPQDDVIVATNQRDHVHGMGSNDTICTLDENDNVVTLRGRDWIDAGEGRNRVTAGPGDDFAKAGSGPDLINCGPGADTASPGGGANIPISCETIVP